MNEGEKDSEKGKEERKKQKGEMIMMIGIEKIIKMGKVYSKSEWKELQAKKRSNWS